MKTIIIKFGGSSLADPGRIRRAAAMVLAARRGGIFPVAVVSAPADSTDDLLKLAALSGGGRRSARETDALLAAGEQLSAALVAMAIEAEGARAVSLTGAQAGIRTNSDFSAAAVRSVNVRRLKRELDAGRIPVVAGFQGVTAGGDVSTLGRGGSDLTAVVLAAALRSELCEFRTDVKGIYTAHPGAVAAARKLKKISYGEIISLAELGTEVRQLRAVKYAARHAIPLHLRSSFHDEPGTLVTPLPAGGPSCLSLKREKRAALVSLIGTGLGASHAAAAAAAAKAAGVRAASAKLSKFALTLGAPQSQGENLLRALHAAFFG
ncbi:MAG: aspartate kinase [Elusimicrobia bacterium]|nr:aspartate kinase [Elusimicrobiota bacterium]